MCIATLLFLVPHTSARPEDVREAAETLYSRIDRAFEHRDSKALDSAYRSRITSDFHTSSLGEVHTYAQTLDGEKEAFADMTGKTKSSTRIVSLTVHGKVATLVVSDSLRTQFKDGHGKLHSCVANDRSRDVWSLGGNHWRISSKTTSQEKMWIDGKLIKLPIYSSQLKNRGH